MVKHLFLAVLPTSTCWVWLSFYTFNCEQSKGSEWTLNWEESLQRFLKATSQGPPFAIWIIIHFNSLFYVTFLLHAPQLSSLPLNTTGPKKTYCVSPLWSQIGMVWASTHRPEEVWTSCFTGPTVLAVSWRSVCHARHFLIIRPRSPQKRT